MDSSSREIDGVVQKTPLENLQDILAKADALAAAVLPPQTKTIFSIEYSESIKKLDELIKAFQMTKMAKGIAIKKNLV